MVHQTKNLNNYDGKLKIKGDIDERLYNTYQMNEKSAFYDHYYSFFAQCANDAIHRKLTYIPNK